MPDVYLSQILPSPGWPNVSVDNLTALKALTARPAAVLVHGKTSINDGWGGVFAWVAGSSTTADDALVVQPTGGASGRYKRVFSGEANVRWFSAKGDDATDDSAAFTAARASGHPLYVPPGAYLVSGVAINSPGHSKSMRGEGLASVIKPPAGSTSSTVLFSVSNDDFHFDNLFFDGPISTTPGSPPALDRPIYFANNSGNGFLRVTNCRIRGGKYGIVFASLSGGYIHCAGNTITDVWAEAINVTQPNICEIVDNQITDCGFDSVASGAIRVGTSTQTEIAESIIVSRNIIARCCEGLAQEGIDLAGVTRTLIVSNNTITDTGNGGIELKTFTPSFTPYVYQNILVTGNAIRLTDLVSSVGISVNLTGTAPTAGTPSKVKVSGNLIMADTAPSTGDACYGVTTTGYTDLEISENLIINVNQGVTLSGAGVSGTTLERAYVTGNKIYAVDNAITDGSGTLQSTHIKDNILYATVGKCVVFDSATVVNLNMEGNYVESVASYAMEMRGGVSDSRVVRNTFVAALDGILTQSSAPSNVEFSNNIIKTTGGSAGHAFNLGTGTGIVLLNNRIDIPLTKRTVTGAGTYTSAGNIRGLVAADPSATMAAALGDIALNSAVASGGFEAWICTTAGNAGAAVWKGTRKIEVIDAPITKTADFTVGTYETTFINNKSGSTCVATLPSASTNSGRELLFINNQPQQLDSASSNVVPLGGGAAGTSILEARAGAWAWLKSDGTNWIIVAGSVLDSYTWATKPATYPARRSLFISDVGPSGSDWKWNGSIWVPNNGVVLLKQSGADLSTAATTEAGGIQIFVDLPAALMGANGVLEFDAMLDSKSSTVAPNILTRLFAGSGAGTGGTALVGTTFTLNNTLWFRARLMNTNAQNAQSSPTLISNVHGLTSSAFGTAAIDTSAASVFRCNVYVGGGNGTTDIAHVRGYSARLWKS